MWYSAPVKCTFFLCRKHYVLICSPVSPSGDGKSWWRWFLTERSNSVWGEWGDHRDGSYFEQPHLGLCWQTMDRAGFPEKEHVKDYCSKNSYHYSWSVLKAILSGQNAHPFYPPPQPTTTTKNHTKQTHTAPAPPKQHTRNPKHSNLNKSNTKSLASPAPQPPRI